MDMPHGRHIRQRIAVYDDDVGKHAGFECAEAVGKPYSVCSQPGDTVEDVSGWHVDRLHEEFHEEMQLIDPGPRGALVATHHQLHPCRVHVADGVVAVF